jgi:hypothetical protein
MTSPLRYSLADVARQIKVNLKFIISTQATYTNTHTLYNINVYHIYILLSTTIFFILNLFNYTPLFKTSSLY